MKMERRIKMFIWSVGFILLNTSLIKIVSAFSWVSVLRNADPLFTVLTNREVLVIVGGIEFALVVWLILSDSGFVKLAGILWISSCFLLYRAGLWLLNVQDCPCLGSTTGWLSRDRALVGNVMAGLAVYMFAVSALFLWPYVRARLPGSNLQPMSAVAITPES